MLCLKHVCCSVNQPENLRHGLSRRGFCLYPVFSVFASTLGSFSRCAELRPAADVRAGLAVVSMVLALFSVPATAQGEEALEDSLQPALKSKVEDKSTPPLCQLQWHNPVSLQDDNLTLELGGETFKITSTGQLYFGIHPVKLNPQQTTVLAEYHRLMQDDLPFVLSHSQLIDDELCTRIAARQAKEGEIQSLIPALRRWQSVSLGE